VIGQYLSLAVIFAITLESLAIMGQLLFGAEVVMTPASGVFADCDAGRGASPNGKRFCSHRLIFLCGPFSRPQLGQACVLRECA
jgi:hypothetical protein